MNGNESIRWARLSIVSNSLLAGLKIVIGLSTGSVSVIAEGLHSLMDLVASIITFMAVHISAKEADRTHHFGHGKFENVAGLVEGLLIFAGGALIIWEALPKLFSDKGPETLGWGLAVMALSSGVNFAVSAKLFKVAKVTHSPALEADAWHLRTDVYTSAGVLGGLVLIKLTGIAIFDPIVALLVACFIMKAAYDITLEGFSHMVDVTIPPHEMEKLDAILDRHGARYLEYHELRARKSGPQRFIDLHLVMPRDLTLQKVHELCDVIEKEIEGGLPNSHVLIHPEPCAETCKECGLATGAGHRRCTQYSDMSDAPEKTGP